MRCQTLSDAFTVVRTLSDVISRCQILDSLSSVHPLALVRISHSLSLSVRVLLEAGAPVNEKNNAMRTALHVAAFEDVSSRMAALSQRHPLGSTVVHRCRWSWSSYS